MEVWYAVPFSEHRERTTQKVVHPEQCVTFINNEYCNASGVPQTNYTSEYTLFWSVSQPKTFGSFCRF